MPDAPEPNKPAVGEVQARLQAIASKLRHAGTLGPQSQQVLAELVDELSKASEAGTVPPAAVTHLAETTAQLAESLHQHPDVGLLGRARDRLDQALLNAEAHAPTAVGLAPRLLDALSNIGI